MCKRFLKKQESAVPHGQAIGSCHGSASNSQPEAPARVDENGHVTEKFLSDWEASIRMQNSGPSNASMGDHEASNTTGRTVGSKQRRSIAELQEIARADQQKRMSDLSFDFGDDDDDWYEEEEQLRRNSAITSPTSPPFIDQHESKKQTLRPPSVGGTPFSAQSSASSFQGLQLPSSESEAAHLPSDTSEKTVNPRPVKRFSGQRPTRKRHSLDVPGSEWGDTSDAVSSLSPANAMQSRARLGSSPRGSPEAKPKRRPLKTRNSPGLIDSDGQHSSQEARRASSVPLQSKRPSARRSAPKKKESGQSGMDNDEWPVNVF